MYPNYNYGSQGGGYGGAPNNYHGQAPNNYPGQAASNYPGQAPQAGYAGVPAQNPGGYMGQQYGGYQNSGINPEIQQWFNTVDRDRSGKINSRELQAALVNGQGKNFSEGACDLMIGMFDKDKSGTIDIQEFQQLYVYINQWLNVFRTYDRDQSGHIEEQELSQALQQMGFRFSPEFVKFLIAKSDLQNHREMSVDQFIVVCVQIQRFTEAFRNRDKEMKGMITIGFEDFLGVALNCSV